MKIPTLRWVSLGYGMVTFTLGGLAFWMPRYLQQFKGLSLAQANLLLFGSVAVAGGLGTLTGGFLGDRFMPRTLNAPLWVSGLGISLALPLAALAIFAAAPLLYMPALSLAIFLLFMNPGVLTAVVVSVAGAPAAGPGGGPEYRGYSPGGRCAFPFSHRLGLGSFQPQMGGFPHPGGPGRRRGLDFQGPAPSAERSGRGRRALAHSTLVPPSWGFFPLTDSERMVILYRTTSMTRGGAAWKLVGLITRRS